MKCRNNGFSLLEMAIVMLIIGLIVGAIFTAQSMIRASQIQTMIGEYDRYLKAVNEFKDKYLALPGDMNNAESMWGSDASCPNTPNTTVPHVATCNGNGDGIIGSPDVFGNLNSGTEFWRAWQQLSDAGMIDGTYTGTGAGITSQPGLNVPLSKLPGAAWTLYSYEQTTQVSNYLWNDQYGHVMSMGGFYNGFPTWAPVLSAPEAFAVDSKIDDGNPGTGFVRGWRTALQPLCTTNDTSQTAQSYVQTNAAGYVCSLLFIMGM